jgi:hypothetical protein
MRGCHAALAHRIASAGRGRPVAGGSWLGGQPSPPSSQPVARNALVDRLEPTMSKLARALVLGATLAAMNLAAMITVAQAQSNDGPTSNQDARRPPTERQVGEAWRHPQVAAAQPAVADDTRRPPTEAQVGEPWRHPTSAPVPSAERSGQPGWLIPSLGVLAAALVLAGGLAVLAAKRAGRRARVRQAA